MEQTGFMKTLADQVRLVFTCLFCLVLGCGTALAEESRDLAGPWRFRIDRADRGIIERWRAGPLPGIDVVMLPGAMQAQGYGDPISVNTPWTGQIVDRSWFTAPEFERYRKEGNVKVPFWLQPDRYYVGAAW